MKSILLIKTLLVLVEMMFGLANVSFSLPEWQAVTKMTFFAPCYLFFFFNIGMFPLEFDEDDPLAGLLSDDEDDLASKPKPKKTSTPKNTRSSGITSQGVLLVIHYFTMYNEFEMVQYTVQHLASKEKNLTLV